MASTCTLAASRQQPASCSGRAQPALRPAAGSTAALCRHRRRRQALPGSMRTSAAANDSSDSPLGGRQPVKRMEFTYLNAEEQAAIDAESDAAWEAGMKEYADLQEWLLFRTWRFGLLFSGYLLLVASGEAAFCELVGAAAGYGYFKWLIADVGRYQPGDRIPMMEAEQIEPKLLRWAAKLGAAYRQALQPRLLVLPGLLAAAAAWNAAFPEDSLGLVEQGCLLGGFLSWKVALVLKIYEDLKPRALTEEELLRQQRPALVEVEDVKLDLREVSKKVEEQQAAAAAAAKAKQQQSQQQQQPKP